MYFILTESPNGNQWVGPYPVEEIRARHARGELADNVGLLDTNNATTTVGAILNPQRDPLAELVTGIGLGLLIVGGALVAREVYYAATNTREQQAIRSSARAHLANGADAVYADHIAGGWDRPPLLGRRRPDVIAVYGREVIVEEHETVESVGRRHSVEQDRDLRQWARRKKRVRYDQIVS